MDPSLKLHERSLCHIRYKTGIVLMLVRKLVSYENVLGAASPFFSEKESSSPLYFSSHYTLSSGVLLVTQAHVYSCVLMMFG